MSEHNNKNSIKEEVKQEDNKQAKTPWHKTRRVKIGSISAVITASVIAVIILVNIIVSVFADKYPMSFDMTSDNTFTMSEETKEYIKSVDKEVTITCFLTESDLKSTFETYYGSSSVVTALEDCTKLNPNISLRYIDLNLVPDQANNYDTTSINSGEIIVFECGGNQEYISDSDLYILGTDDTTGTSFDSYGMPVVEGDQIERCIVTNLLLATMDEKPNAAVLQGHEDTGSAYFEYWIENIGLEITYAELLLEDIPENTDFIVIAAPTTDYAQTEIDKLNKFLERNGSNSIIVFLEASQPGLPNLEAFLAKWGIQVESGMVAETDSSKHAADMPELMVAEPGDAEDNFIEELGSRQILTYRTRAMSVLFDTQDDITVDTLLQTYDTAAIIQDDGSYGEEQNYPVLTRSSRTDDSEEDAVDSVYVFATVEIFNQSLIETYSGAINNESMATTLINNLSSRSINVDIPDRNITARVLDINQAQATILGLFLAVLFIPVIVLVTGFFIWYRRRRL